MPIPLFALACLILLPREERALRWGAALYGLGATLALVLDTPMGGNAVRLGALFGGPVLLCALWRRPLARSRVALPLLRWLAALAFWQWSPAVRDMIKYVEDPAAEAGYYEPLREFLATLPDQRRIEIPFTRTHWEAAEVARRARRWRAAGCASSTSGATRSSTTARSPATYASWLAENAVRYVALPEREAGQQLLRRARADRARACPTCGALALGATGASTR